MAMIGRNTIIFFLPLDMGAFSEDGKYERRQESYKRVQLYLNPHTFNISDNKILQSKQTKGGFMTQYWGEKLTQITMMGTTGSSGIEGINIIRQIYRHEQIRMRELLAERQRAIAERAVQSASEAAITSQERTGLAGTLTNIADLATGGAFSQAVSGVGNAIDIITEPFSGSDSSVSSRKSFGAPPTMAALATSVDMYYQGETFRGYFEGLEVKEQGQQPGLFDYTLRFTVTRTTGSRSNFMPWHRNPYDHDGEARKAPPSTVSKNLYPEVDYLSFPIETDNPGAYAGGRQRRTPTGLQINEGAVRSQLDEPLQEGDVDSANRPASRRSQSTSSS